MSVYLELTTLSDDTKLDGDVTLNTNDVTKVPIVDDEYNAYNESDEEPDVEDLVRNIFWESSKESSKESLKESLREN